MARLSRLSNIWRYKSFYPKEGLCSLTYTMVDNVARASPFKEMKLRLLLLWRKYLKIYLMGELMFQTMYDVCKAPQT